MTVSCGMIKVYDVRC